VFKKILIANRGEIATRIIKTCKRLNIKTVAVFSSADHDSLHVRSADEAYMIGDPPAAKSYLRQDRIIETALKAGAEAIHPGYGFLSENPTFSATVERSGLVFIGPSASAIRKAGDKVNARRLAMKNDVPVLPGAQGTIKSIDEARAIAREIGYPVLIKASAGGGGKGMRTVRDENGLTNAIDSARNESKSAFGSSNIFLEKYVEPAKHIEIQIVADNHGNCVHFGERECSVQRRHQKIVEETPSVVVSPEMRDAMGEAAKRLALGAGYSGAGTVEFIVDDRNNFYFLEMNTRLQVEHPITELCNDVDLVELQLEVASGKKLKTKQKNVAPRGAAIECRICAEDPSKDHLPSSGVIRSLRFPSFVDLRVDTYLYEGYEVKLYYDSLLAKIIAYGADRGAAVQTMKTALDGTMIQGVETNIRLCRSVLDNEEFASGRYTTNLLEKMALVKVTDESHPVVMSGPVGNHIYDSTF
jgi:acetyl-CoA carboxylase biotin carboxylase subunit